MHDYRRGMTVLVTTEPAAEPVLAADVQARAGVSGDEAIIEAFITATRQQVELFLDRALITQSLRLSLNGFPYWNRLGSAGWISLPRAPLQSIDSVKYYNTNDTEQTLSASLYLALTNYVPGRLQAKYGEPWPSDVRMDSVVQVNYVAGYGDDAGDVPQAIRQAILLQATETYQAKRPGIVSERIDNASRTYIDESTRWDASLGTGFSPAVLSLLQPYQVISL